MAYFTVINCNNDKGTWSYYKDRDGSAMARYNYNSANAGDDWLITPPLKVEKGKTYTVKFKARSNSADFIERLEVKYGSTKTVEGMKNVILDQQIFLATHSMNTPRRLQLLKTAPVYRIPRNQ